MTSIADSSSSPPPYSTTSAGWKTNTKRVAQITGSGAYLFLTSLKEASDVFPPLKSAAAGIIILVDLVSNFSKNKEEWNDLARIVAERVSGVAKQVGKNPSPDLRDSIESLNRVLESITNEIQRMQERNRLTRALSVQADKEKIASFYSRMKNELDTLSLLANMTILRLADAPHDEEHSGPLDSDVNWNAPPPPIHFYGRDEYLQSMISLIQKKLSATNASSGAHLLIRGPGGIGKTTVAQSLFHHPTIESSFGENRFFVQCESSSNRALLLSSIASALHLDITKKNALSSILSFLRKASEPLLLVLDNAETFWHAPSRADVKNVLQHIGSIKRITLIMTMRGIELPTAIKWDSLPPLDSLSLKASREAFLAIAEIDEVDLQKEVDLVDVDEKPPDPLDLLLNEIDRVPLAITLLARIHQTGGTPAQSSSASISALHKRLLEEKSDLMSMGSTYIDREDNIGISIKLSLESQLMIQNPSALRLLKLLALLPAGASISALERNSVITESDESSAPPTLKDITGGDIIYGETPMTAMSLSSLRKGSHTLKHLLLASELPSSNRIYSLSPIRMYFLKHHSPNKHDLLYLRRWYIELAASARSTLHDNDYPSTLPVLKQEKGNISSLLENVIDDRGQNFPADDSTLLAIAGFARFLSEFDIPDTTLLEKIIDQYRLGLYGNSSKQTRVLIAICLTMYGGSKRRLSDMVTAEKFMSEALTEFTKLGHNFDVAETSKELGDIKSALSKFPEALLHLKTARSMFEKMKRPYNAAICIEELGDVYRHMGDFAEAELLLSEALRIFEGLETSSGTIFNIGRCLYSLGEIRTRQRSLSEAESYHSRAQELFEKVDERAALANCLRSHGNVKRLRFKFDEAQEILIKARKEFRELGMRTEAALCLHDLGDMNRYRQHFDDAVRFLKKAEEEYAQIGDERRRVSCLYTIGEMRISQGKDEEAKQILEDAVERFKAINSERDIAKCLYGLANIAFKTSKLTDAFTLFQKAKSGFQGTNDAFNAAISIGRLGAVKKRMGDQTEAERYLLEAKEKLQPLNDPFELGKVLRDLAELARTQGRYSEAEQFFREAGSSFQNAGTKRNAIDCLYEIGNTIRMQNRFEDALQVLVYAVEVSRSTGEEYLIAISLYCIGEVTMSEVLSKATTAKELDERSESVQEAFEIADQRLSESLDILRRLPSTQPADLGTRLLKFAGYAFTSKKFDKARALIDECLPLLRSVGLDSEVAIAENIQARIEAKKSSL